MLTSINKKQADINNDGMINSSDALTVLRISVGMEGIQSLPASFYCENEGGAHVQGIAVDAEHGYVYYSFTTELIKTDFSGKIIGSVKDLNGHLGCITYDSEKDRVYGSLEYKHDSIGSGFINNVSKEDAFYLASFDCPKIKSSDISAINNDVMKTVYLREVIEDYSSTDENSGKKHNYGCSGIDGVATGPAFGGSRDVRKLMVAYGIYSETDRTDNDYQIILQYDTDIFEKYGKTTNRISLSHSGPESCEKKYCFYTGNTSYGIQNLEYDDTTDCYFAAVYPGQKTSFDNFNMFCIDRKSAPSKAKMTGRKEYGEVLSAGSALSASDGKNGKRFGLGACGMASMGGGIWYFAESGYDPSDNYYSAKVNKYMLKNGVFTLIKQL